MKTENLFCKVLLLFPVFTLFQSFSFLSWINKFLLFCAFVLLINVLFPDFKVRKKWVVLLCLVVFVHIYAFLQTCFPLYNSNMLFYYGFWVLLSIYYINYPEQAANILRKNKKYIKLIIQIWSIIVFISVFLPSSYVINKAWGGGRYFVSITGDTFRLAPACLMITTLAFSLYCFTEKKKSLFYIIIPMYSFLMCGSRTYLGVGLLVVLVFWYIYCNKKKYFYISLLPLICVFSFLILNSAAGAKIISTSYTTSSFFDKWGTITNGRTIFWELDIKYFLKENILNQIFGCGFNFDYLITERYYTSAHWAHNDFIGILLNFGYVGLGIYLFLMYKLLKKYLSGIKMPKIVCLIVFMIWFLNAMFNMFYTYTCSMICFPILLISLREHYLLKEGNLYEYQ